MDIINESEFSVDEITKETIKCMKLSGKRLLFLIIIALVTVFAVKTFMPDLFETEKKYGVGPIGVEGHTNI